MTIHGTVSRLREARVAVTVRGAVGRADQTLDALIDTGYEDYLTLPTNIVAMLDLPFARDQEIQVVGGGLVTLPVYYAVIIFGGKEMAGEVMAADNPPLIGMALLDGYDLHIEVVAGGNVSLTPMPLTPA
ncbi:MAG: clan AA aspartic protease [Armatimonadetes bacterium]|nr:clan AA aspartic protease [Armatimonadota bacterium]